jgi:hypothetical protein
MSRFRDRREEYEEEDDEIEDREERQKKLFRNKDFRDLNPKDKKARREPKKPWGKKERLLVLVTILLTAGLSAFLYLSSRGLLKTPDFSEIRSPKINVPNLGEETIIYKKEITPTQVY